jgi:hypothetical protein
MFTDWPAFWGFLGAVIYAAPKMTTCFFAEAGRAHLRRCLIEGVTALLIGTVAAAAFQPWIAGYLHATTPAASQAMSAMIGMLANTVAPGVIRVLADTALARLRGGQ